MNSAPARMQAPQETTPASLAPLLKAAGDPLRLDILRLMARDSFAVLELCQILDGKQSGISHHLKVLAAAGWLASRREGNSIFYRRASFAPGHPHRSLARTLFASLDAGPLPPHLYHRLAQVQAERARASRQFFLDNADKFRQQQDLIASYPVYAEQITQLLRDTPLPGHELAVEVGPGEGEFLAVLAERFARVVALDNAERMLERARAQLEQQGLSRVEPVLGDAERMSEHGWAAQAIVANMVLHHTPSPADIFVQFSRSLAPGGALLITDLCRHEQDWARSACGDLWQGFEPEDFSRWAAQAGLVEGQSMYFALRNGFQVQLRQFFKPE